jgi:hypothetical protein
MAKFSGYGTLIGSRTTMSNREEDTRHGKDYGVSARCLERNRLILKEFYALSADENVKRNTIAPLLGKKFGVSAWQIRVILKKMRGR